MTASIGTPRESDIMEVKEGEFSIVSKCVRKII
jgi:hypothetical protein